MLLFYNPIYFLALHFPVFWKGVESVDAIVGPVILRFRCKCCVFCQANEPVKKVVITTSPSTATGRNSPDHRKREITASTLLWFTTSTTGIQAIPGSRVWQWCAEQLTTQKLTKCIPKTCYNLKMVELTLKGVNFHFAPQGKKRQSTEKHEKTEKMQEKSYKYTRKVG